MLTWNVQRFFNSKRDCSTLSVYSELVAISGGNTKICENICWDFLPQKLFCVRLPTIENIFG